jgi:cytochrome c peroxidase
MTLLQRILILVLITGISCSDDPPSNPGDLSHIPFTPEKYPLVIPMGLPSLADSLVDKVTKDGVQLGRHLFYDPILSSDSTMSCASCHDPRKAFTDNLSVSTGVTGVAGTRSSMSILNAVYFNNGMFWDGRAGNLEKQAIEPVQNPIELHEIWPNVVTKLKRHPSYPEKFRKAFGITSRDEITKELAANAIAQFESILLTGGNSLYQRQKRGELFFNGDQQIGHDLFFNTEPLIPDAECFHCHADPLLMSGIDFFNNGIDSVGSLDDFIDKGRGVVTNLRFDNGKFKAPSLYNIVLTAPYMHDGRFKTLEEVIDHYNSGGHYADNKNSFIRPLGLNAGQKRDLLAFLKTLTDTSYLENPDVLSPF